MRIYVACLAAYNNGRLHGRWIEAQADADLMQDEVNAMLASSPVPGAEEWAIHDFEGLPSSMGEYCGLKAVAEFVELVEECDLEPEDVAAIVSNFQTVEEAGNNLRDNFVGVYPSFRDYAEEHADEMLACEGHKDDSLAARYFDYESFARDLKMDMSVVDLDRGVAIFHA